MEIKLPEPRLKGMKSLEECIFERESVRTYDDEVKKILNLPKNIDPIYLIPVGYPV